MVSKSKSKEAQVSKGQRKDLAVSKAQMSEAKSVQSNLAKKMRFTSTIEKTQAQRYLMTSQNRLAGARRWCCRLPPKNGRISSLP
ncbi:unnamed protein product [Prunus brigantina]